MTAEAAQLRRNSVDQELPGQELAVLQANYGAVAAKHEEALGKLAALQVAKEAAEASKASALAEAAQHQQNARSHAIRRALQAHTPLFLVGNAEVADVDCLIGSVRLSAHGCHIK